MLTISYNLIGNTSLLQFIIQLIDQLNLASINIMLILYYLVVNLTLIWLASSSCATIRHLPVALILTTNLAAVVCVCAKFEQFLALRSYFESIRPENFVRIAKFPYAAFGPLFAFHCPLFFYEKQ